MNKNLRTALKSLSKNRLKDVKINSKILKDGIFVIDSKIKQRKRNEYKLKENWKWFCDNQLPPAVINAIIRWSDGDICGKLLDSIK